jgi:hypothetical protein
LLVVAVAYLIASLLVGFAGRGRQIGFAGFFVLSLLLTPLVTYLIYLLGAPRDIPQ